MAFNPYGIVSSVEEQIGSEQPFTPMFDQNQTRQLADQYKVNRSLFSPEEVERIKQHSAYHNVPFYEGEFNIGEAIMQFGQGVFSGFTTFNVGDHPDNEYEAISRNIGHLVGFAPNMIARPFMKVKALSGWAQKLAGVKSVPMWGAEKIREKAIEAFGPAVKTAISGRADAASTAGKFLTRYKGPAKHIAEGAFDLGVASGISAWQGGINAVMESTFHGALAGGVFRTLGNAINLGDEKASKIARGLAGSLYEGLHAEHRGATTPEKVYHYLLGAFFGYNEAPILELNLLSL